MTEEMAALQSMKGATTETDLMEELDDVMVIGLRIGTGGGFL
jgi:hypothetical protein